MKCSLCGKERKEKDCQRQTANNGDIFVACDYCLTSLKGKYVIICGNCGTVAPVEWSRVLEKEPKLEGLYLKTIQEDMVFISRISKCPNCIKP